MPFIPHTQQDIEDMLATIGANSIEELFDEIPSTLRFDKFTHIPKGVNEMALGQMLATRAARDLAGLCFIGAGAYEHHIPAAVWDITSRGEFLTAYTPYQAEASQGTLQLIYEYQTMMANLLGMDVANASLYDGASALAEALLMAVRLQRKGQAKCVLLPASLNPFYRLVAETILKNQGIVIESLPYSAKHGCILPESLEAYAGKEIAALVIPQPNFFGRVEEVDMLTDWAHQQGAMVVAVVNPTAMALLKEPGSWGTMSKTAPPPPPSAPPPTGGGGNLLGLTKGADIVCGEGQPLGIPLASGGPYFGFMACKAAYVRQMPGRIVGRTVDTEGKEGFVLTLQAREQHIRRSKATSNICTNQGLLVTAATIYMSLLGAEGLHRVAAASHQGAVVLMKKLLAIPGVELIFNGPIFHEFVIRLPVPVAQVLNKLAVTAETMTAIQGGYDLSEQYPELGNALLICVTETKTEEDLSAYAQRLDLILSELTA